VRFEALSSGSTEKKKRAVREKKALMKEGRNGDQTRMFPAVRNRTTKTRGNVPWLCYSAKEDFMLQKKGETITAKESIKAKASQPFIKEVSLP